MESVRWLKSSTGLGFLEVIYVHVGKQTWDNSCVHLSPVQSEAAQLNLTSIAHINSVILLLRSRTQNATFSFPVENPTSQSVAISITRAQNLPNVIPPTFRVRYSISLSDEYSRRCVVVHRTWKQTRYVWKNTDKTFLYWRRSRPIPKQPMDLYKSSTSTKLRVLYPRTEPILHDKWLLSLLLSPPPKEEG